MTLVEVTSSWVRAQNCRHVPRSSRCERDAAILACPMCLALRGCERDAAILVCRWLRCKARLESLMLVKPRVTSCDS